MWGLEDDAGPTLTIHESSSSIGADDVEDLEKPTVETVAAVDTTTVDTAAATVDIDAPLSSTGDFEELQ
jgi:hypothetical protein